jgi:1,3-beta-glucanosyltransferase GAS1
MVDLLVDEKSCIRNIPYLVSLSINVLFIFDINTKLDHSECMRRLALAGIYVLVRLSGLNPPAPEKNDLVWAPEDYKRIEFMEQVVDEYAKYNNTLGFSVTMAPMMSQFQMLWARKLWIIEAKAYIKQKSYREIPIGIELFEYVSVVRQSRCTYIKR